VNAQAVFFCIVVGGSLKMTSRLIMIGMTTLIFVVLFCGGTIFRLAAKVIAAVDGSPIQTPTVENRHAFDETRPTLPGKTTMPKHRLYIGELVNAKNLSSSFRRFKHDVIEKILRHCGLWRWSAPRSPPATAGSGRYGRCPSFEQRAA
jgi:hypothetical protein